MFSTLNIGIEFEFYLQNNIERNNIENIIFRYLRKINPNIIIKNCLFNNKLPADTYKSSNLFYIEKDNSLKKNGIEFITKVINYNELSFYLKCIFQLIQDIGYTKEETGLHFHISNEDNSFLNKNSFLNDLKNNKLSFLENERNDISSIFDLLVNNKYIEVQDKFKKDYNINFIEDKNYNNHIELRALGGKNYENNLKKIFADLTIFFNIYKKNLIL